MADSFDSADGATHFLTQPTRDLLRFFEFEHLPEPLKTVSRHYHELAEWTAYNTRWSAEQTVALRKLLEAKDAAVRAALPRATLPAEETR